MNVLLCGLAENPALPAELVDRLIAVADTDVADVLARRADLTHDQAVALVARVEESALPLAYGGHLTAADIDPVTRPDAALALLDRGAGAPWWARLLVTGPVARRERLAACPDLPSDVVEALATDPELGVVAELALWTTSRWTAGLAAHPHAEVRRAVAANEAAPAAVLAALVTGDGLPPLRRCPACDRGEGPSVHDPRGPRPHGVLSPGASCDGSHESAVHDIRLAALRNPATPVHAVAALADHPSRLLRQALAARPDLPADVCRRLVADPVAGVRAELAANAVLDDASNVLFVGPPGVGKTMLSVALGRAAVDAG
ncbi:ATP-binding protein, partial [Streptomyces lavendulocolor]|uniref:ATP-binding protein n=1 Tax=Streptomyces lavendulocolor TaxID=67316 RepID=UPI0033FC56BE